MKNIKINRISDYEWEIPKEGEMLVPARIFASKDLLELMKQDITLEQAKNVSMLPGIISKSIIMPDAHQGYGFSIGGVAAFDLEKGVISPGGVGYDINCSVRLLRTNLNFRDIEEKKSEIAKILFKAISSGVGKKGNINLESKEIEDVLINGAQWAIKKGYGKEKDWKHTEENGKIPNANPKDVSERAKARGKNQLGSIGAGNHFLEIQRVDEVFNKEICKKIGIKKDQITIMIHCGSRGLGHQVASDYIQLMEKEYGFPKQDRELINAPIKSELGKKYLSAMACAANFAFANKQIITQIIRKSLKEIFSNFEAEVVYDVCHNIAKIEKHIINKKEKEILVTRKGATRAFGPGRKELPKEYQKIGQPVIIPGSMGTESYILIGTKESESLSWASTAHGAGRLESRSKAIKELIGEEIKKTLNKKGIEVCTNSIKGLAEEAPQVYKDVNEVVNVSDKLGLAKIVAKVKPIIVIKG